MRPESESASTNKFTNPYFQDICVLIVHSPSSTEAVLGQTLITGPVLKWSNSFSHDRKRVWVSLPSPEGDLRIINAPSFLQNHNGEQGLIQGVKFYRTKSQGSYFKYCPASKLLPSHLLKMCLVSQPQWQVHSGSPQPPGPWGTAGTQSQGLHPLPVFPPISCWTGTSLFREFTLAIG